MNKQLKLEIDDRGNKFWKLNNKLHREDGPAIEYRDGNVEWWVNGELHREDGPAVEFRKFKQWYHCGYLHRDDGPAIITSFGEIYWFLKDKQYSFEEWFQELTPAQQYNYLWSLDE